MHIAVYHGEGRLELEGPRRWLPSSLRSFIKGPPSKFYDERDILGMRGTYIHCTDPDVADWLKARLPATALLI